VSKQGGCAAWLELRSAPAARVTVAMCVIATGCTAARRPLHHALRCTQGRATKRIRQHTTRLAALRGVPPGPRWNARGGRTVYAG
jgi:hypothetical protein